MLTQKGVVSSSTIVNFAHIIRDHLAKTTHKISIKSAICKVWDRMCECMCEKERESEIISSHQEISCSVSSIQNVTGSIKKMDSTQNY